MITTIIILLILISVLSFTTWNLLRKLEKYEDVQEKYQKTYINLSKLIKVADIKLNELDSKQTFSSDDEIGWFFNYTKELQNEIKKTL
jgi:hypothetical protein